MMFTIEDFEAKILKYGFAIIDAVSDFDNEIFASRKFTFGDMHEVCEYCIADYDVFFILR